jgi:hypothetical protein
MVPMTRQRHFWSSSATLRVLLRAISSLLQSGSSIRVFGKEAESKVVGDPNARVQMQRRTEFCSLLTTFDCALGCSHSRDLRLAHVQWAEM